jgi:hypothetical protein
VRADTPRQAERKDETLKIGHSHEEADRADRDDDASLAPGAEDRDDLKSSAPEVSAPAAGVLGSACHNSGRWGSTECGSGE